MRTRKLLQEALKKLSTTRPFEEISVQEITDVATVNRATFYAHYPDKFALLESLVASQFGELLEKRGVTFDGTCSSAITAIVLGVCDFLAKRYGAPGIGARRIEPQVEIAIIEVVRRMLLDGLKAHPAPGCASVEMLASTASWAIYGGAKEWVQTARRPSARKGADTVTRLAAAILYPVG